MKITYKYNLPSKTFGSLVGEIIGRASNYWTSHNYDILEINIRPYGVIYTVHKCLKNKKKSKWGNYK